MQTKLAKYVINYPNEEEYHTLKNEIFINNCYHFDSTDSTPLIVDVGAYIGLSILYFNREFQGCKIIAFEPNPKAFEMLKENIFINNIENVELHESAIWVEDGQKKLYIDKTGKERYSVASFIPNAWNSEVESESITVKTERLDTYLNQEIDLLKLDVEGAEQKILKGIRRYFKNIKNIIVEYHPTKDQGINEVIEILNPSYDLNIYKDGKKINRNIPKNTLLSIHAIYRC